MNTTMLPTDFGDLELFSEWALEQRADRFHKRVSSSIEKITSFYDAMVPRLDEVVKYLNSKPLASLEQSDKQLLAMALSLIEVSRCLELWKAPDIDAFAADRLIFDL